MYALVIPFKTLQVAQIQKAQAEAPVALVVSQAYQPVSHDSVFGVELDPMAIANLANAKLRCLAALLPWVRSANWTRTDALVTEKPISSW